VALLGQSCSVEIQASLVQWNRSVETKGQNGVCSGDCGQAVIEVGEVRHRSTLDLDRGYYGEAPGRPAGRSGAGLQETLCADLNAAEPSWSADDEPSIGRLAGNLRLGGKWISDGGKRL